MTSFPVGPSRFDGYSKKRCKHAMPYGLVNLAKPDGLIHAQSLVDCCTEPQGKK
jgi:hypothetical protein